MKIMFGSVVYKDAMAYLDDFLSSVQMQSFKAFDLVLINDDIQPNKINDRLSEKNIIIEHTNGIYSVVELRIRLLEYAIKHHYDLLIFGDIDDTFSHTRVEKIMRAYDENMGFYYHDLTLIGTKTSFFGNRLPENTTVIEQIVDYNYLGLSNTAINIALTKKLLSNLKNQKVIAYDWYLFSCLLLNQYIGKKVEDCTSYYRIHERNIAGETNYLTDMKLERGINVKKEHYQTLKQYLNVFQEKYEKIIMLERKLSEKEYKEAYLNYINKILPDKCFWWENIKLCDEVEVFQ